MSLNSLAGIKVYDNRDSTDLQGITHGDLVVTEHEVLVSRHGRLHFYCLLDEVSMAARLLNAVMIAPAEVAA